MLVPSLLTTLALTAGGCCLPSVDAPEGTDPADLLLRRGAIYTLNPDQLWAETLAVRDGVLVYVGPDAGADAFVGPSTQVLDLDGAMALPGLHDSHLHLIEAHHPAAGTCQLPGGQNPESFIPIIWNCAPNQLGTDWVLGYGHSIYDLIDHYDAGGRNPLDILDDAVPDRPAAFLEETSHSVWVNRQALAAAGIDASTPDPPGGVILRDPFNGALLGILLESAGEQVMDLAFTPNPELDALDAEALRDGMAHANRFGITSIGEARAHWRRGHLRAWQEARDQDTLTVRAVLGLWAYPYLDDTDQIADLTALFDNDPTSKLRANQLKIYADGEISHTTAALLDDYTCCWLDAPRGLEVFGPERLERYLTDLGAVGFDFHIHAIGDRGVRNALDAIEASGTFTNQRHRITHLELTHPDDISRFAPLGVTADFQMSSEFVELDHLADFVPLLGNHRVDHHLLRLRDFHDAGARVVLSSDFDVGELSPFAGMQRALDRGDQSLPNLEAALRAYTIEPARLLRQEDRLGSLEVGKLADVIVLDRNLFDIPVTELRDTQVVRTFLGGRQVWPAPLGLFADGFEAGTTSAWSNASP